MKSCSKPDGGCGDEEVPLDLSECTRQRMQQCARHLGLSCEEFIHLAISQYLPHMEDGVATVDGEDG